MMPMLLAGHRVIALRMLFVALAFAAASPGAQAGGFHLFDSDDTGATRQAIESALAKTDSGAIDLSARPQASDQVHAFYAARDFEPAWSGNDDARERAAHVREVLEHAEDQGLGNSAYALPSKIDTDSPAPGTEAANYDIALTSALLRYAADLRTGRVRPSSVYEDVNLPGETFDAAAALARAVRHDEIGDFLAALPPTSAGYRRLATALFHYRTIVASGGWTKISAGASTAVLAERLSLEDVSISPHAGAAEVKDAVARFQRRHGLADNGIVGAETLAALNVSAAQRAKQIGVNMERWRWLPRQLERRYIMVDAADQSLDYFSDGQSRLHSRVVIGRKDSRTPILRTTVNAVIANPPWDIPPDIAARSHLTGQNPKALAARGISYGEDGMLRQRPGPGNALGTLMLDAPNQFAVYMHDTPHKELFQLAVRERSNGCVRVEKIFDLASLALADSVEEGAEGLHAAIDTHETTRLELRDPLIAYYVYWTAIGDDEGGVAFRPDRYGRDAPLLALLTGADS